MKTSFFAKEVGDFILLHNQASKPFIWVGLLFENYLILLKAPPPSTTSFEESSVKIHFLKLIPTPHSEFVCVNESRGGICREGKFLTYHKLTRYTTKSTKYNQLQSATCCYQVLLSLLRRQQKFSKCHARINYTSAHVSDDINSPTCVSDDICNPISVSDDIRGPIRL